MKPSFNIVLNIVPVFVAFIFLVFSFGFHFDLTDESLYFYLLEKGTDSMFVSQFHWIGHWWGEIFGHTLFNYRILSLFALLSSSFFFITNLINYFRFKDDNFELRAFVTFCSLYYFHSISTFSYNTLIVCLVYLYAGLLFKILQTENKTKYRLISYIVFISFVIYLSFFARFTSLIFLLFLTSFTLLTLLGKESKKLILGISFSVFILLMLTFFIWDDYFLDFYKILIAQASSSHGNLFDLYLGISFGTLKTFILFTFLFVFLFKIFSLLKFNNKYFCLNFFLFFLFLYFLTRLDSLDFKEIEKRSFPILAALCFSMVYYLNLLKDRKIWLLIFLFVSTLAAGIGSNGNFIKHSVMLIGLQLGIVFYLLRVFKIRYEFFLFFKLVVFSLVFYRLYQTQYVNYYRSGLITEQTSTVELNSLKNIKIRKEYVEIFQKFQEIEFSSMFSMKHIGVFSYPDIPGFVAALKGNAIGNVWSFSGYKNSDESNCAYIDIAFKNNTYDEIYFLLASELTKDLKHCLGHYVQLNQKVPSIEMGSFYSERNRKNYNLKLLGPYSSIK